MSEGIKVFEVAHSAPARKVRFALERLFALEHSAALHGGTMGHGIGHREYARLEDLWIVIMEPVLDLLDLFVTDSLCHRAIVQIAHRQIEHTGLLSSGLLRFRLLSEVGVPFCRLVLFS